MVPGAFCYVNYKLFSGTFAAPAQARMGLDGEEIPEKRTMNL